MVRVTQIQLLDRLYLEGPPGIGKTEVIRDKSMEEAKELGRVFVDLRKADDNVLNKIMDNPGHYYVYYRIIAPHVFPEDLGIPRPRIRNSISYIEFMPPKVLKIMELRGIAGVLFIDELSNLARDDQQAMMYSLLQEKEAAWMLKLSDDIKIIAAGNPPKWSRLANPLPEPLLDRLIKIEVEPPTVDEWIDYMYRKHGEDWETVVAVFLKNYPEYLLYKQEGGENIPIATPRSWTRLAINLKRIRDEKFREALVYGNVAPQPASIFLSLLRTKIDIAKTLGTLANQPEKFTSFDTNAKLLIINALASRELHELVNKYGKLLKYLLNRETEMLMLLLMLMPREKRIRMIHEYADEEMIEVLHDVLKDFE